MAGEETIDYPTDEEFDSWDEAKEGEALKVFADPGTFAVKTVIKGTSLFVRAPSGNKYRLPLALSISNYSALAGSDDADPIEALKSIAHEFCPEKSAEFDREPVQVVASIIKALGEAVTKTQGATLGE